MNELNSLVFVLIYTTIIIIAFNFLSFLDEGINYALPYCYVLFLCFIVAYALIVRKLKVQDLKASQYVLDNP